MVCLHDVEVARIDLLAFVADCHRFPILRFHSAFSKSPVAAFFLFGLGIGRKYCEVEELKQTICKVFRVHLRLFLEDLAIRFSLDFCSRDEPFIAYN